MEQFTGFHLDWVRDVYPAQYLPEAALVAGCPPKPDIPQEIVDEANRQFFDLEYSDNFRAFRACDWYGYEWFMWRELRGCCGAAHGVAFDNDGQRWYIACNYGH